MTFTNYIEWAFLGATSAIVYILWLVYQSLSELNVKIAVIIERTDRHQQNLEKHEERFERFDERLRTLETHKTH